MTLLELCEPLFQHICRLKRLGRSGHTIETDQIRVEIKNTFKSMATLAAESPNLAVQYEKVELPLIFFVDFMIKESRLGLSAPWVELAIDRNELAGDEKFFDLLDATLEESGESADERLAVFYTCLGLGFTGVYIGQPESIRNMMTRITVRISSMMDADERSNICPEAYENVDTSDLVHPPGMKLTGIGIALVSLIVVWLVGYVIVFKQVGNTVNRGVDNILEYEKTDNNKSVPD